MIYSRNIPFLSEILDLPVLVILWVCDCWQIKCRVRSQLHTHESGLGRGAWCCWCCPCICWDHLCKWWQCCTCIGVVCQCWFVKQIPFFLSAVSIVLQVGSCSPILTALCVCVDSWGPCRKPCQYPWRWYRQRGAVSRWERSTQPRLSSLCK